MGKEDAYEHELKRYIRNAEERFISYKKMLEGVHRDKEAFPPQEEWVIEYKDSLRDAKNQEESRLKDLIEEKTHYPGITPIQFKKWSDKHMRESRMRHAAASIETAFEHMSASQKEAAGKLLALING